MIPTDFAIVLGRQFGAGGRKLGHLLSERLGASYYDKEMLCRAAERYGFRPGIFDRADERRPSLLQSLLCFNFESAAGSYSTTAMGASELYQAQSHVIAELAKEGPCIFVGRTADYVLRDHKCLISVFLHADEDTRASSIIGRGDCSTEREAIEMARRNDRLRQDYYTYFTGRQWGVASNYDLSLNMGRITTETAADIIEQLLREYARKAK